MKKSIPSIQSAFLKYVLYSLSIVFFCLTSNVKAQLINEAAISTGPVFVPHSTVDPAGYGASFSASNGFGIQIDYKLMNKAVGIQLSFSYVLNNYDGDYASDVLNASSYDGDNWNSIMGLVKFVARETVIKEKLFIDLSLGFGALQGNFSQQSFKYEDSSSSAYQVRNMYSPEKNASGIALSAGMRVSYRIVDDLSLFINYDYLYSAQNYSVVYQEISSSIDSITKVTRIKRNYSMLFIGVAVLIN